MHTELTLFCERCGLRLPARLEHCPRCDGALLGRQALTKTPAFGWLSPVEAVRALLVHGGALLVYVLSAAGAVHLTFLQGGSSNAMAALPWVALPALVGGFLGVGIGLGLFWLVWVGFVYLVFFFVPRRGAAPVWVAAPQSDARCYRLARQLGRLGEWTADRSWRSWLLPPIVWLVLLLAFQLITDPGWFVTAATNHVVKVLVAVVVGAIVMWLLLSPALVIAVGFLAKLLTDFERALLSLWLQRPVSLAALLRKRKASASFHGRTSHSAPLIAPLSGTPCVGFRLLGRVDGMELNDAWLADFEVENEEAPSARVIAAGALLMLPVGAPEEVSLSDEQALRLRDCLDERGIPSPLKNVQLAEALLEPGAGVRVWAQQSEERADASAGYRELAVRVVLSGTDAEPVLIAPA